MHTPILTKSFIAGADIPRATVVKHGDSDGKVTKATAATDALLGVTAELDVKQGEPVDVHVMGIVEVQYGGTVESGGVLTVNNAGQAVSIGENPASKTRILGVAMTAGAAGEIGAVLLSPGFIK